MWHYERSSPSLLEVPTNQHLHGKNEQDALGQNQTGTHGAHKVFALQNSNICKQNTNNFSFSLSIIFSIHTQIFKKK